MENAVNQTATFPIVTINQSQIIPDDILRNRDPFYVIIPLTILYIVVFLTGIIGNVSTCVVISRNRHMHTATNYYLFSLAISDLLLLIFGLPSETIVLYSKHRYPFTNEFCLLGGFAAETSANATVLTITAFTIERYVAICHPFRSHTLSKLSRAVRFVFAIWVLAMVFATPLSIQYGVVTYNDHRVSYCSIKFFLFYDAFLVSTFVMFILPMSVITVLYILIGIKLHLSVRMSAKRPSVSSDRDASRSGSATSQRHVINMLVAVVVAFFFCWAPFHAQRLWAIHLQHHPNSNPTTIMLYNILKHISGILYYLSTTVNPLLYNIMSKKFRLAFKSTLSHKCGKATPPDRRSPCGTLRRITPPSSCRRHDSIVLMKSENSQKTRIVRSSSGGDGNNNNGVSDGRMPTMHERHIDALRGSKPTHLNAKPYVTSDGRRAKAKTALSCIGKKFRMIPDTTKNLFCHNDGKHEENHLGGDNQQCIKTTFPKAPTVSSSTISNSSLLDMDLTEFTTGELTKIVGQLKNGNATSIY